MFTFRYHAISLIAVFLALGIGVLLGVAIGENGVVSDASKDLERSLRGDLKNARSKNADLRREIDQRDRLRAPAYPGLVNDLLPHWRVGIVAMGDLPSGYTSAVRAAVEPAGAKVDSVTVIGRSASVRPAGLAAGRNEARAPGPLGRRGRALRAQGGPPAGRRRRSDRRLGPDLFSASRGEYKGLDAVIYVRDRADTRGRKKHLQDSFEAGFIDGLRDGDAKIVGVEKTDTDPSQVGFMKDRKVTSVDDLDLVAGKTALVWGLLGGEGHFGVKGSAERLLPAAPKTG